jgi:hypothetical protein
MAQVKTAGERERYRTLKAMLEDRRRDIQDKLRSLRETLPAEVGQVRDFGSRAWTTSCRRWTSR